MSNKLTNSPLNVQDIEQFTLREQGKEMNENELADEIVFYGRLRNPNCYVDALWTQVILFDDHDYNIKIVFDNKTGKLKSAEVIK